MLYYLDLLGTLAFAISGAYLAKKEKLHILAVILLGLITAVGGGTARDLILARTPLFYLKDPAYLLVALSGGVLTYLMPIFFKKAYSFFRLMDSAGLAAFVIIGVSVSFNRLFIPSDGISLISFLVCVFFGMLTGFGGSVIRESVMGRMPLSLKKKSNYALSAFAGASSFYLLMFWNIQLAMVVSVLITLALREFFSPYGIYKKVSKGI